MAVFILQHTGTIDSTKAHIENLKAFVLLGIEKPPLVYQELNSTAKIQNNLKVSRNLQDKSLWARLQGR